MGTSKEKAVLTVISWDETGLVPLQLQLIVEGQHGIAILADE